MLYRICLRSALEQDGRAFIVERDSIQSILQEMELGTSDLADPRAKTEIGRLLPASLLLIGDVIPQKGGDRIFVRLVDTETTRVLGTFLAAADPQGDILVACESLSSNVMQKAVQAKPLTAPVLSREGDALKIGAGRFHGATEGLGLQIVSRSDPAAGDRVIGTARITAVGEDASTCEAQWTEPPAGRIGRPVRGSGSPRPDRIRRRGCCESPRVSASTLRCRAFLRDASSCFGLRRLAWRPRGRHPAPARHDSARLRAAA